LNVQASYLPKVDRDDSHHDSSPIKGGRGLRFREALKTHGCPSRIFQILLRQRPFVSVKGLIQAFETIGSTVNFGRGIVLKGACLLRRAELTVLVTVDVAL
jgi:hypothetical protein